MHLIKIQDVNLLGIRCHKMYLINDRRYQISMIGNGSQSEDMIMKRGRECWTDG